MSTTFLRLELASDRPGDIVLVNVDHIVSIHPRWPGGCSIITSDITSVNVRATLDELQARLLSTGGRAHVYNVEHDEHGIDPVYEAARADLLP